MEPGTVPDYYTAGAQDPGRGQHYPLVHRRVVLPSAVVILGQSDLFSIGAKPLDLASDVKDGTKQPGAGGLDFGRNLIQNG